MRGAGVGGVGEVDFSNLLTRAEVRMERFGRPALGRR